MAAPIVGVLALQGDSQRHVQTLGTLPVEVRTVRRAEELDACAALVLPGGESTTLRKLIAINDLLTPLLDFAATRPMLGTCAGLILMAVHLEDPGGVDPLGILDVDVRRNGFGRQVDSFEDTLTPLVEQLGNGSPRGVFIRAPRILRVGKSVTALAVHGQEPVAVRQGLHWGLTFHPELTGDPRWHRSWLAGAGLLA